MVGSEGLMNFDLFLLFFCFVWGSWFDHGMMAGNGVKWSLYMLVEVGCGKFLVWYEIPGLGFEFALFWSDLFGHVRGWMRLKLKHESCRK